MAGIDTTLNKLSPKQVAEAIRAIRPTNIALYVHGAPGIAKSAVAQQVADQAGIAFIDVRLSQMAPEDVRGVPVMGELYGMKGLLWQPPMLFPRDLDYEGEATITGTATIRFFNPFGDNGIHYCTAPVIKVMSNDFDKQVEIVDQQVDRFTVFVRDFKGEQSTASIRWWVTGKTKAILGLEEFNSAPPSVMATAYQLVLDRRIGEYIVPDGVMLLAMGNRDGDKGVTFKLPLPLANRFIHIEMVVKLEDWLDWAGRNAIHPDVVGYLAKWPSKLLDFHPESPNLSFATPRSWEMVSKIISESCERETCRALVCGAIGTAIGTDFLMHSEYMADMPDANGILDGTITTFKPSNRQHAVQISYSTAVQLTYLLKERSDVIDRKGSTARAEWYEQADRAIGYIMDFFAPEVSVVAMRMAMLTHGLRFLSKEMPRWVEFNKVNKDIFF